MAIHTYEISHACQHPSNFLWLLPLSITTQMGVTATILYSKNKLAIHVKILELLHLLLEISVVLCHVLSNVMEFLPWEVRYKTMHTVLLQSEFFNHIPTKSCKH